MSVSNKITKSLYWVFFHTPYISKSGSQTRINAIFIPKWRRYSLKSNEGTRYLESRYTLLILYDTGENGTSIKSLAKNSFLNIDKNKTKEKREIKVPHYRLKVRICCFLEYNYWFCVNITINLSESCLEE